MTNGAFDLPTDDAAEAALQTRAARRPPTAVPGYELRRFLGAGAYGEVWVAIDANTGRSVAIKFFADRKSLDSSLLAHETEKLVFLSADRYVVQLLEVGWDAEPPYYVMEYIEQGSLEDRLRLFGPLPVADAVELFREIAIGLSHAHGKGVLHCDLKPANVLLDQDRRPRLADFGQSRLTHEQRPALGTLFYMAPEQARLDALPDVRWDVYALGALLYCMLTGAPPHRDDEALSEIDSAQGLSGRLEKYRQRIERHPATAHRTVPGIDRALVEIIDGCLAIHPAQRFAHVPSVLEALADRQRARRRRPLLLLGLVGPLLLLLITGIFGYRGYVRAIRESQNLAQASTMETNRFAAEGAANNVAYELDKRFRAVTGVAENPELLELVRRLQTEPKTAGALQQLAVQANAEPLASRAAFVECPHRQPLQQWIADLMRDRRTPPAASWFVTDRYGTFLAAAFDTDPEDSPIGKNFAYRTYFHGGPRDLPGVRPATPITGPHLSALLKSTSTARWKVAISAPIVLDGETWGVLAMTVELGEFVRFPTSRDQYAVLVDGRDGDYLGVILQHPLFDQVLKEEGRLPDDFIRHRVDVAALRKNRGSGTYVDPLSADPLGGAYAGEWIAGTAPVQLDLVNMSGGSDPFDTGLVLLVQKRLEDATHPVARLGRKLLREGLAALVVVILVSIALWYFVIRWLEESPHGQVASADVEEDFLAVHARETLEVPIRKSRS